MRVLKRGMATPINVVAGDRVQLIYSDGGGRRVVLDEAITEAHVFDDAVILESDPGEFGADYGIGGLFLETKSKKKKKE